MGFGAFVVDEGEPLIVEHNGRFSLVLWSSDLGEPVPITVDPTPAEIEEGWHRANEQRDLRATELPPGIPHPREIQEAFALQPGVALEAQASQPFQLLIVPRVEEEPTTVPSPASPVNAGTFVSSAGVFASDSVGRVGVTAAAHAVPSGTAVTVGGIAGAVVAREDDPIYDACFIEVPAFAAGIPPNARRSHGPLKLAPRMNDRVEFEGIGSGSNPVPSAYIRAANYELPYLDPNLQQTVRTDRVTARQDSGAALIDSQDFVVGFAHSRSASNPGLTYSTWIWALAVVSKLQLTVL